MRPWQFEEVTVEAPARIDLDGGRANWFVASRRARGRRSIGTHKEILQPSVRENDGGTNAERRPVREVRRYRPEVLSWPV